MENNWCIKLNDENRYVVLGYLNEKYNKTFNGNAIYYGINNINEADYWHGKSSSLREITTEQFIEMIQYEGYKVMYNPIIKKHEYVCKPAYSGIKFNSSSNILQTSKNNPPINNGFGVVFGSDNKFHKSDLDLNITPKQIQSDGGSTQYYQIEITNSNGEKFNCELNDILRDVFNNQWDLCNIVKASRRISEARKGQGKKDVGVKYDANKIIWFAEEIKKYGK